jgi:hypothetical protein
VAIREYAGHRDGWMTTDGKSNYSSNDQSEVPKPCSKEGVSAKEELSNQVASRVD